MIKVQMLIQGPVRNLDYFITLGKDVARTFKKGDLRKLITIIFMVEESDMGVSQQRFRTAIFEWLRFGFQYLYRYFNLSFNQSDVPDIPD